MKRLIGILSAAGGLELELEDQGMRLRIRMPEPQSRTEFVGIPSMAPGAFPGYPPATGAAPAAAAEASGEDGLPAGSVYVNSPMVGTFYRASSPDAEPFVGVGDRVEVDATVCILEAMKVMNEIKAEQAGEIVRILVENGEPVEFGQPLFILKVS
ncbi:MAG: acetyl-CoA carboxylase biotin carboxyl carrier protein [Planctomycetes bacterium]|nr:acetyl-CoA carboxylase biotin carboxyl carrier protein [Planctomycetota bacterium]